MASSSSCWCGVRLKRLKLVYLGFSSGILALLMVSVWMLMVYDSSLIPVLEQHTVSVVSSSPKPPLDILRPSETPSADRGFTDTWRHLPVRKIGQLYDSKELREDTVFLPKLLPVDVLERDTTMATGHAELQENSNISRSDRGVALPELVDTLNSNLEVAKDSEYGISNENVKINDYASFDTNLGLDGNTSFYDGDLYSPEPQDTLDPSIEALIDSVYTYDSPASSLDQSMYPLEEVDMLSSNTAPLTDQDYSISHQIQTINSTYTLDVETSDIVTELRDQSSPSLNLVHVLENLRTDLPPDVAAPSDLASPEKKQHGYVLVGRFSGQSQQAVGLRAFMSPQCWIGSFNLPMYIVEPFITRSIVHTRVQHNRDTKLLSLSDFYDLEHYNAESRKQGMAEAARWEDFIDNAPRDLIWVTLGSLPKDCTCLMSVQNGRTKRPKVTWKSSKMQRCRKLIVPSGVKMLTVLHGFCVVRIVTINPTPYICSQREMHSLIFGGWKPQNVTVVFGFWCPGMYIPNHSLRLPKRCQTACSWGLENKYLPSPQLLRHVRDYETKITADQGELGVKLAVMLRTEHVVYPLPVLQRPLGAKLCLIKTANIVHTLKEKLGVKRPFVTVDIGKYGSGTWSQSLPKNDKHILSNIKATLLGFYGHSMSFSQWERTFTDVTGGITDRGYIAALQKTIASRADCLVLLGGGNFLRLALHEYLELHPEVSSWCLYFVCVEDRFRREYDMALYKHSRRQAKPSWQLLPENRSFKLYVGSVNKLSLT